MVAGLERLLESSRQPGLPELRAALSELLGGSTAAGRLVCEEPLEGSGSVNRVWFEIDGKALSVVTKRSRPNVALRNAFVLRRWLPAVGLESGAPRILATAAEHSGLCVWHVYEDLGGKTLVTDRDPTAVRSAIDLLGEIHMRFVGHPMLTEAREWGGDLGPGFYESNVRDAIMCLEAISPSRVDGSGAEPGLRDRVLERMWALCDDGRRRTEIIAALGGPHTLLHGDLWLKNAAVVRDRDAVRVRLIDWDRAGVGPIGYDLSTFLSKFPHHERDGVLEQYEEVISATWELPSRDDLNYLFETFELARLANCVRWAAFAMNDEPQSRWPVEELELTDSWLASLEPVLETPEPTT